MWLAGGQPSAMLMSAFPASYNPRRVGCQEINGPPQAAHIVYTTSHIKSILVGFMMVYYKNGVLAVNS
jgi:hypothetical protein